MRLRHITIAVLLLGLALSGASPQGATARDFDEIVVVVERPCLAAPRLHRGCKCVSRDDLHDNCDTMIVAGDDIIQCIWKSEEECTHLPGKSACGVTFDQFYICKDMGTGETCWPEVDPCDTYVYCGDCCCEVMRGSTCPCGCDLVETAVCEEGACENNECVVRERDCDDGNQCTEDWCDDCYGCLALPVLDGSVCDDGNPCTVEHCQGGACASTPADGMPCEDDGNACTDDVCYGGACTHPATSGGSCGDCQTCDEGACVGVCEGGEQCCGGDCCTDPCCGESCCESAACMVCSNGVCKSTCNDDNPCTEDLCEEGSCAYPQLDCDDNNPCTVDSCCEHPSEDGRPGCINDDEAWGCFVTLGQASGCPGSTVELDYEVCNASDACEESYAWTLIEHNPPPPPAEPVFVNLPLSGSAGSVEPGECSAGSIAIEIAASAEPGLVPVLLRMYSYATDYCNSSGLVEGESCGDLRIIEVKAIDLDVDSDNDGDMDDDDDAIEDEGHSAAHPGKWLWLNNDDSDGLGHMDNAPPNDGWIDGPADRVDIGELIVQPIDPELADDPRIFLETTNPAAVRVFQTRTSGAAAILGPSAGNSCEIPYAMYGNTFGMEGVAPGSTTISLVLKDGEVEVCRDEVTVTAVGLEVDWETLDGQPLPANDHPDAPIGLKAYPGATDTEGTWSDWVHVRVATNPPVAGAVVYMKGL